ncbi:MAG: RpiB/LacA/LacB family sugar-phosphate isomerase [Candidatus Zapsychrus exili]|nr:RpiB/LacA/LacB family sugar-phosphate isomerase [Candidatus Zapsychrus exili]
MKIYIGADHRGFDIKKNIIKNLEKRSYEIVDVGIHSADIKSFDYPRIAYRVASQVVESRNNRGILVCMTGIGQAIAANKVKGAYAAVCYNSKVAALSRQHNNSNILVLGANFVKKSELQKIVDIWLSSEFEGSKQIRHKRRVGQIKKIEKGLKLK